MTQTVGLQAQLQMQQFQAGVNQFNAGIAQMVSGAQQMSSASAGMVTGTASAGESIEKAGDDAVTTAAKIEILEKAFDQVRILAEQGLELAQLGAQAKRVETRFAAFAKEAGGAEEILAAFQKGAGGTVSKMDAMASASRLLQMGLVDNADEMATVVEMATRLGDQTQSAGDRVGDFAALLANQSIPRLDNFGISSGAVRLRIEELQAATAGLSREAAFSQAVFEQGAISLEKLGVRVDDDASKMERAQAKMEDFRVEMGQKLAPIAGKLADVLGGLESSTLALGIGLSTAAGIALKFSGGLSGLTTALGTSAMALGALAAAAAVLIWRFDELQKTQQEINAAVEQGQDKIEGWSDEVAAMADEGLSAESAVGQLAQRLNEATNKFNNNAIASSILGEAFGASDKIARLLGDSMTEIDEIAMSSSSTYDEYTSIINAFNAELTDEDAKVRAVSESTYALRQRIDEMTESEKALAVAQMLYKNGLVEQSDVMKAAAAVVEDHRQVTGELGAKIENLTKQTETMGRATQSVYLNQVAPAIEAADTNLLAYIASQQREESQAQRNQSVYMSQVVPALQDVARQNEETGNSVLAHAERQTKLAEAARDAAQAAQDERVAMLDMAEALKDASATQIAKKALDDLKKSLDAGILSEEDYTVAVMNTQDAYGLVTPESRALAEGIDYLNSELVAGRISSNDYTEALGVMTQDARDGSLDIEKLNEAFAITTTSEEAAAHWAAALGDEMPIMGGKVKDAADVVSNSRDDIQGLGGDFDRLGESAANAGAAMGDQLAGSIEASIPNVLRAVHNLADAVMDNLPRSEPKDPSSPFRGLEGRGEAVVTMFSMGMVGAIPTAVTDFQMVGEILGDSLVDAIIESLEDGESAIDRFLDVGSRLGRIGGVFAGIFEEETVGPMEDHLDGMADRLEDIGDAIGESRERQLEYQAALAETGISLQDALYLEAHGQAFELTAEQRHLLAMINEERQTGLALSNEQTATLEEQAALREEFAVQQQRLLEFQEKQQQLQIMQQQQELLSLISEYGLDPAEILGDLELGKDVDIGGLMEALTRAMSDIVDITSEELETIGDKDPIDWGDLFPPGTIIDDGSSKDGGDLGDLLPPGTIIVLPGGDKDPFDPGNLFPPGSLSLPNFSSPTTTLGGDTEINIILTGNSFANPAAMRGAASMLKQELAPLFRGEC